MTETLTTIVFESWSVLCEMAPYLLFGFLVAGILSICISPQFVERHLGRKGFTPVWKAAMFGVPLPLCSCGVIPVAASFRRHGASQAAVTSFLLSTPQTGVDSIAVTYALLGGLFAVYRPIAALATGLLGGLLVMLSTQPNHSLAPHESPTPRCTESCCAERHRHNIVWRSLEYGFVTLPRDIGLALLLGVVIAGAITALVPANQWHAYLGGGLLSIVIAMLIGTPLYVCASASVPIAAGLIHMGASPGAALAFLIAGPATNAATIATVWKLLGRTTAAIYLASIALSAVLGGLLLDWLYRSLDIALPVLTTHTHEMHAASWLGTFWAILLLAILAYSYTAKPHEEEHPAMEVVDVANETPIELAIDGMTCDHCKATVVQALENCQGVRSVQVNLPKGRATILGNPLNVDNLVAAVKSAGYRAHPVANDASTR
jgi:uncharacterized membrane protein YraQ (UPF0718 family)/copper chaperone CopZ